MGGKVLPNFVFILWKGDFRILKHFYKEEGLFRGFENFDCTKGGVFDRSLFGKICGFNIFCGG